MRDDGPKIFNIIPHIYRTGDGFRAAYTAVDTLWEANERVAVLTRGIAAGEGFFAYVALRGTAGIIVSPGALNPYLHGVLDWFSKNDELAPAVTCEDDPRVRDMAVIPGKTLVTYAFFTHHSDSRIQAMARILNTTLRPIGDVDRRYPGARESGDVYLCMRSHNNVPAQYHKNLSAEVISQIAGRVAAAGYRPVWHNMGDEIGNPPDVRWPTPLGMIERLRRARACISIDTSTMWISAALGLPTLGIFNLANPHRLVGGWGPNLRVTTPRFLHSGKMPEQHANEVSAFLRHVEATDR